DCSGHGTCRVSGGSAVCDCNEGYTASGLECVEDSDPCDDVACESHEVCVGGQCELREGRCNDDGDCDGALVCNMGHSCVSADQTCASIDCYELDPNTDGCDDSSGEPVCVCEAGYENDGPTRCNRVEPNPCDDLNCGPNGHCEVIASTAECICDAGYHASDFACHADPAWPPSEWTPDSWSSAYCPSDEVDDDPSWNQLVGDGIWDFYLQPGDTDTYWIQGGWQEKVTVELTNALTTEGEHVYIQLCTTDANQVCSTGMSSTPGVLTFEGGAERHYFTVSYDTTRYGTDGDECSVYRLRVTKECLPDRVYAEGTDYGYVYWTELRTIPKSGATHRYPVGLEDYGDDYRVRIDDHAGMDSFDYWMQHPEDGRQYFSSDYAGRPEYYDSLSNDDLPYDGEIVVDSLPSSDSHCPAYEISFELPQ
ncbi:MAG: hypothetical protein ACOCVR_01755, partial [Myxococcota bacterium]